MKNKRLNKRSLLMMSLFVKLLVLASLWGGVVFARGSDAGNGGDLIICDPSPDSQFQGHYSLDYLFTFNPLNNNEDIVIVNSWEESYQRIRHFLEVYTSPEVVGNFDSFHHLRENFQDYSQQRVWSAGPGTLIDIKDEYLIRMLSDNCTKVDSENNRYLQIRQVVIRYEDHGQITYEFSPDDYLKLKENPIQYSFLMVHEWLRDYFKDSYLIRKINRFLHSNVWENASPESVFKSLVNLKFFVEGLNTYFLDETNANFKSRVLYLRTKLMEALKSDDVEMFKNFVSQVIRPHWIPTYDFMDSIFKKGEDGIAYLEILHQNNLITSDYSTMAYFTGAFPAIKFLEKIGFPLEESMQRRALDQLQEALKRTKEISGLVSLIIRDAEKLFKDSNLPNLHTYIALEILDQIYSKNRDLFFKVMKESSFLRNYAVGVNEQNNLSLRRDDWGSGYVTWELKRSNMIVRTILNGDTQKLAQLLKMDEVKRNLNRCDYVILRDIISRNYFNASILKIAELRLSYFEDDEYDVTREDKVIALEKIIEMLEDNGAESCYESR